MLCDAPRPMCQVSSSYSLWLPCHFLRVMHLISCHHVHFICIRVRLMHSSIFSRCPFCIPALLSQPVSLFTSFHVRVLNILGLDRYLSCGLGLLPVDRLSSFVPFGLRLILQRLTEGPKRPRVCCSPTPLKSGPNPTPLNLLHHLGPSVTITWPKTAPHLESPSSLYL